MTLSICIEFLR